MSIVRTDPMAEAATRSAVVAGVRRLTAFALVQVNPPRLAMRLDASGAVVQFQPVPGWTHTLERTAELESWIDVATPAGIEPVTRPTRPRRPDTPCTGCGWRGPNRNDSVEPAAWRSGAPPARADRS